MIDLRNPDYSLRQLQYAVAVQITGGFGRAAEQCGVAQPSLSAQVAKLEAVLGVRLFERASRGVRVTAAGQVLLERMRAVLEASGALSEAARSVVDPYALPLRVGVIPTVAPYLLPGVVDQLAARDLAPVVHWIERQTADLERDLAEGLLDAALIADPPSFDAQSRVVGWEPLVAIVPEDSEVCGPIALNDFAKLPVLLLEDGHCLRDHAMALCMKPGASEAPYRATSLPTLVQMVSAGLGVSVLPRSAIPVELPRARVRAVPFTSDAIGRSLHLVWRHASPRSVVLDELAEVIRLQIATAGDAEGP